MLQCLSLCSPCWQVTWRARSGGNRGDIKSRVTACMPSVSFLKRRRRRTEKQNDLFDSFHFIFFHDLLLRSFIIFSISALLCVSACFSPDQLCAIQFPHFLDSVCVWLRYWLFSTFLLRAFKFYGCAICRHYRCRHRGVLNYFGRSLHSNSLTKLL